MLFKSSNDLVHKKFQSQTRNNTFGQGINLGEKSSNAFFIKLITYYVIIHTYKHTHSSNFTRTCFNQFYPNFNLMYFMLKHSSMIPLLVSIMCPKERLSIWNTTIWIYNKLEAWRNHTYKACVMKKMNKMEAPKFLEVSAKRMKWMKAPSFVNSKLQGGFPITSFDSKMC